jgi:hypothetical protein
VLTHGRLARVQVHLVAPHSPAAPPPASDTPTKASQVDSKAELESDTLTQAESKAELESVHAESMRSKMRSPRSRFSARGSQRTARSGSRRRTSAGSSSWASGSYSDESR